MSWSQEIDLNGEAIMQQLTKNVFVETGVRGCNHGFVKTACGIVMIDTPQKPTDALKWRDEIARHAGVLLEEFYNADRRLYQIDTILAARFLP